MRTAKPLVTWSRITLCKPSATSLSISTPRLIGPGCMIRQSGFKSFARSFVRPNKRMYSPSPGRSEEHTSELQSHSDLVCRLLLEKKKTPRTKLETDYQLASDTL